MKSAEEFIVESFLAYPDSLRLALVTETFPPEINGVAMTLGNLVKGLLKRGHAVQVVADPHLDVRHQRRLRTACCAANFRFVTHDVSSMLVRARSSGVPSRWWSKYSTTAFHAAHPLLPTAPAFFGPV